MQHIKLQRAKLGQSSNDRINSNKHNEYIRLSSKDCRIDVKQPIEFSLFYHQLENSV